MAAPNSYLIEGLDEAQLAYLKSAGFPTFDEYAKNPDKYRDTWEEVFQCIEHGPEVLRDLTAGKHVLKVCGTKCESIGQMIRIAKDMGFDLKKMTFEVNLENVGGGKFIHHVNLIPKPVTTVEEGAEG